ncbi:MAG: flagellin [Deltaproteobacteria bacterium]|nr:flagellin [Deltaproteobacteria bacterium]
MRVTDTTKHNTVRQNINKTTETLQKLMGQMSSGKKVLKPSDDPVGSAMVQDFMTSIDHGKTLVRNIGADKIWLNNMELAITQISDILVNVKQLALQGGDAAATKEFRASIAKEFETISHELVRLANKKIGKLFMFSGTKTFTQPLKMNELQTEPMISFERTRLKSQTEIIPLHQDKPLPGLRPGTFQIILDDESEKPPFLDITLNGTESIMDIVENINNKAIEAYGWQPSEHTVSGYESDVHAEVGQDNALYLDPVFGSKIRFGEIDPTGFLQMMKFGVIGDPAEINPELPLLFQAHVAVPNDFDGSFLGYSKNNYQIKIIKGGTYSTAQYVVSDDEGETWSRPQTLTRKNEIFNPEGKASDKVYLEFLAVGKPFFKEGLEFSFEGNEFVEYRGNHQLKDVLIDNGIKVALNVTAHELFFEKEDEENSVNVFEVINRLVQSMREDEPLAALKSLDEINKAINQVLDKRSRIGTIYKELEASEERIEADLDFKTNELSNIEDLDIAKASMDLNSAELKNKVALDSAARLIQPTLINFLK